jgi:hypothetical protein
MTNEEKPEWFRMEMSAKQVVDRLLEENGDDFELFFVDEKKMVRVIDRIKEAHTAEKCRLDPFFFLEHYKSEIHYPDLYLTLAVLAKETHPNFESYICVQPECHYIRYENTEHEGQSIKQCRLCGAHTAINARVVIEHGTVPDVVLMALAQQRYRKIKSAALKCATLARMAAEQEHIAITLYDYRPTLRISKDMPGFRVDGDHFIRGRVNREVLLEAKATPWPMEGDGPDDFIAGQDADPITDIMMMWYNTDEETVDLLKRVIDEPKVFLDPSKADKFREEYIDARWDEEFGKFVAALIDKNILAVDSSGVKDTLTTLYHLAQRKVDKKTVIRKNGNIRFPTHEVLENISPDLIKRAFAVTEHGAYVDPQQVFRLGEVTHE